MKGHPKQHPGMGRHHHLAAAAHHARQAASGGGGAEAAVSAEGGGTKYPFIWGVQEQRVPVATIPITMGAKAATVRIPKNGYLLKLLYRFVGKANVTGAGSAGKPQIWQVLQNVTVSYNGGFQYRSMDGESMYVMDLVRSKGADIIANGPNFKNYNPASATNQDVAFILEDYIGLNTQRNADKYLLAAHARNADITLDVTFGTNPNGTQALDGIGANTETAAITGTLYVEGLYLLDPPSYALFDEPDLNKVQQILTDTSFTNVVVGDNTVPIVPLNGPKYLQLLVKGVFNLVADTQGFSSSISRFQLKLNNGLNRIDMSSQALAQENMKQLERYQCGQANQFTAALPAGWYMFDMLNANNVNNTADRIDPQGNTIMRNALSTEKLALLWLIPTVASGTTLTANNQFKLIKRVELPAVGGTNRLAHAR